MQICSTLIGDGWWFSEQRGVRLSVIKMVLQSIRIVYCLVALGLMNCFVENTKETSGKDERNSNLALLIAYANKRFSPSVKMKKKSSTYKFSEFPYIKGYALKTPNAKFDALSANQTRIAMGFGRSSNEQRRKRGVLHLYNMISCATGCNPLGYMGYGCYCGLWGSGYPADGIDRCCELHGSCYYDTGCPLFLEYFVPYFWKCYYNRPLCAIDHAEFGGPGSCASKLCECDRMLSECLSHYPCPSSKSFCKSSPLRWLHNALSIFP